MNGFFLKCEFYQNEVAWVLNIDLTNMLNNLYFLISVNANVCSIRMVVSPEFLMPLLEFFNKGLTASISATQTSHYDSKGLNT